MVPALLRTFYRVFGITSEWDYQYPMTSLTSFALSIRPSGQHQLATPILDALLTALHFVSGLWRNNNLRIPITWWFPHCFEFFIGPSGQHQNEDTDTQWHPTFALFFALLLHWSFRITSEWGCRYPMTSLISFTPSLHCSAPFSTLTFHRAFGVTSTWGSRWPLISSPLFTFYRAFRTTST